MKITKELIKKVAENARLDLTDKEIREFIPQLAEILEDFSTLDKANTNNVNPGIQPVQKKNVYREDEMGKCLSREDALSNTKHKQDGYFKGPKVI